MDISIVSVIKIEIFRYTLTGGFHHVSRLKFLQALVCIYLF